jgi:hypothetical protein
MARNSSWRTGHEQRAYRCPGGPHPTPSTPTQKARTSSGPRPPHPQRHSVVLRTGCRWPDLPPRYGSPVTCWRRLDQWQTEGTWESMWRAFLSILDQQGKLDWSRAFLDGSFVPAKRGSGNRADPKRQREQADAGGRESGSTHWWVGR